MIEEDKLGGGEWGGPCMVVENREKRSLLRKNKCTKDVKYPSANSFLKT